MKIFILSDNPFSKSAYAQSAVGLSHKLLQWGHDVLYMGASYYGTDHEVNGLKICGNNKLHENRLTLSPHLERFQPDIIVTIADPLRFPIELFARYRVPWVSFCATDTEPLPISLEHEYRGVYRVLTPSKFIQSQLKNELDCKADYCPLWLDAAYKAGDKKSLREKLHIPQDDFVVCMVADNKEYPSRKNFEPLLIAWASFIHEYPKSRLILHTNLGAEAGGVNLYPLIEIFKIPQYNILAPNQNAYPLEFDNEYMASMYRVSDVFITPSGGEGFCSPIIEASACGIPVIASHFTAMRDHQVAWWLEDGETIWNHRYNAFRYLPTKKAIYQRLLDALEAKASGTIEAKGQEALAYAQNFEKEKVLETYWKPVFEDIQKCLEGGLV